MQFPVLVLILSLYTCIAWAEEETASTPEPETAAEVESSAEQAVKDSEGKEVKTTDEAEDEEPDCE